MSNPTIRVEEISKMYRIGVQAVKPKTRLGAVGQTLASPLRYLRTMTREPTEDEILWAVRDVSFEVNEGNVLGIIGRNGAGKSTLLKILSRVTEPTHGQAILNGRVGSLLEVGTGFHPELTGRENVYLNGAILGMRNEEIKRKFDEIVDFSGVEQFLDTPVKRYSSGMRVRLAFAVAANLDPEILIVDEVLAVGDAEFQRKCLGKMSTVAGEGRTVLFVSHNMSAVAQLCDSLIWLDKGQVHMRGETEHIVAQYLTSEANVFGVQEWPEGFARSGVDEFALHAVRILDGNNRVSAMLDGNEPFLIETEYDVKLPLDYCRIGLTITTVEGVTVFEAYDIDEPGYAGERTTGRHVSRCRVPGHLLRPGRFTVSVKAGIPNKKNFARADHLLTFDVKGTAATGLQAGERKERAGIIAPRLDWERRSLNGVHR